MNLDDSRLEAGRLLTLSVRTRCLEESGFPAPCGAGERRGHDLFTLLDVCVSSSRRGHANLLWIVPILTDGSRSESEMKTRFLHIDIPTVTNHRQSFVNMPIGHHMHALEHGCRVVGARFAFYRHQPENIARRSHSSVG